MTLLLDTHIWLWLALDNKRLARNNLHLIEKMPDGHLAVSVASVWEIALLAHDGKLEMDYSPRVWIENSRKELGLEIIPLTADIVLESYNLPGVFHKDPADRMIVATARRMGLSLVTQDKAILAYARKGHIIIAK